MKKCSTCREEKPLTRFSPRKGVPDGLSYVCKDCANAAFRLKRQNDPAEREKRNRYARNYRKTHFEAEQARNRRSKLRFTYSMEPAEYDRRAAEQGGLCAICKQPPVGKKYLSVDHDHSTGKLRALLCDRCNVGLGSFKDDPAILERAAAYLWQWSDDGDHPRIRSGDHQG